MIEPRNYLSWRAPVVECAWGRADLPRRPPAEARQGKQRRGVSVSSRLAAIIRRAVVPDESQDIDVFPRIKGADPAEPPARACGEVAEVLFFEIAWAPVLATPKVPCFLKNASCLRRKKRYSKKIVAPPSAGDWLLPAQENDGNQETNY